MKLDIFFLTFQIYIFIHNPSSHICAVKWKLFFWNLFVILKCDFASKKVLSPLRFLKCEKKAKTKSPQVLVKENDICQNSHERSVREIGTLARVLSWKIWLKNVILVRKQFLMVPQLESISWCLFQKTREDVAFHIRGLKNTPHSCPPKQTGIYNAIFLDVLIQILRYTRQIKA